MQSYHKLIVYQKAKKLVLLTYKLTKTYPRIELYVLIPQMRRAAISVLANIVEGYVKSRKEFNRFIGISIGSATELGVFFELSHELKYLNKQETKQAFDLVTEVKKMLYSFQKSLKGGITAKR